MSIRGLAKAMFLLDNPDCLWRNEPLWVRADYMVKAERLLVGTSKQSYLTGNKRFNNRYKVYKRC